MLPPSGLTRSVDVHRQRIITQVQLAREMATEHIQKAQVKMKHYYDQHSRDHPFEVGHKVWIYNPAVKPGLTKKLSCLWHGPYRLMDQVSPVSFKVSDVKGKLLKGTVHVSRMKQLYTLQDKPTQELEVWHNEVLQKDQIDEDISTDEEQDASFNEEQPEKNKIISQPSGDLQKPLESAQMENVSTELNLQIEQDLNPINNSIDNTQKHAEAECEDTEGNSSKAQLHDQTDQNVQQTTAQNYPEGIRQEINPAEEGVFLVERIKKKRIRDGEPQYLIKWQGFSERENTWEPANHLNPLLIETYLAEQNISKKANRNGGISVNTLHFLSLNQPRRHNRWNIAMWLCQLLLFSISSTMAVKSPVELGSLYDCTKTTPMGIYEYPSLRDCGHNMNNIDAELTTYQAEVYRYSPNVTKFDMYLCSFETIDLRCDRTNIFKSSKKTRKVTKTRISPAECLLGIRNMTAGRTEQKLEQIEENYWKNKFTEKYPCSFGHDVQIRLRLFEMKRYPAQVIGKSLTIEQHLTRTRCSSTIDSKLNIGTCTPHSQPKQIIVWENPHHDQTEMHSLGMYEVQRQGDYVLIQDLHAGGAVQEEFGPQLNT